MNFGNKLSSNIENIRMNMMTSFEMEDKMWNDTFQEDRRRQQVMQVLKVLKTELEMHGTC